MYSHTFRCNNTTTITTNVYLAFHLKLHLEYLHDGGSKSITSLTTYTVSLAHILNYGSLW